MEDVLDRCTLSGMDVRRARSPARVVVAGGGLAALEALVALREMAGPRVALELVSPRPTLDFRPAATFESFADAEPLRYDLGAIAADVGAGYRRDAVAAVARDVRRVRLESFRHLDYDALVLAVGTQARASVPGALTFRDQRDAIQVRRVLAELEAGAIRRVAFAVPAGVSWPLPAYELALLCGARAEARAAEVALVTPERTPLAALGPQASAAVARVLAERNVRFYGDAIPAAVHRGGRLELHSGGWLPADRVIAVPELRGRRIAGVPSDWGGFVPVDADGRVEGMDAVYAAGDLTDFPLKHGGLATRQADVAVRAIARSLGVAANGVPDEPMLRLTLLGGERPLGLRIALDDRGRPAETAIRNESPLPDPRAGKVRGRYLSPYLAGRAPIAT